MLKSLFRSWIGRFERTWNYDAGYMRYVLEASPATRLGSFSHGGTLYSS